MAALLVIIIISVAVLIMAFSASILGLGELDMGYTSQKGQEARALTEGCLEEALRQLRLHTSYGGSTLNFGQNSCIISIIVDGSRRTISVLGTVENFNKNIQAIITLGGSEITLNSWQEKSN
jgi:hypothetical protein